MDYYTIDRGAAGYFDLAEQYDTALDAETYAASIGKPGTAMLRSDYLATPTVQGQQLDAAKSEKTLELTSEGNRRLALLNFLFTDVVSAYMLGLVIKPSSMQALGGDVVAVGNAWAAAWSAIDALPTITDVENYNVETDPAWPS